MPIEQYYLGALDLEPQGLDGITLPVRRKPADYLNQYASVFNTVVGNTTFYAVPPEETVQRWLAATPDDFQF